MGHSLFLIVKKNMAMLALIMAVFFGCSFCDAKDAPSSSKSLPHWVHLSKSRVYGRAGPGSNYPIQYVYEAPMLPMKVLAYREGFYKVQDYEGSKSWIYRTMLSHKMPAYLIESDCLFYKNESETKPYAILEKNVILRLKKCRGARCFGYVRMYEGCFDPKSCKGWGGLPHA